MRIVALNTNGRGGPAIVDWVTSCNADVIVLAEWRATEASERLRRTLEHEGFTTRCSVRDGRNCNGLLIAAKHAFNVERATPEDADRGELLLARLPNDLIVAAAYFPQLGAKAPFFEKCVGLARNYVAVPLLLIGDLNTGRNDVDIEGGGTPFHCEKLFIALETRAELRDLWRKEHGDLQEWTWQSHATKRSRAHSFRLDHAFGNQELISRLAPIHCRYDHQPRESSITDHSALIVELGNRVAR